MARTNGHTIHRYQGEKIYRAEFIARKYRADSYDHEAESDPDDHSSWIFTSAATCPCSQCAIETR